MDRTRAQHIHPFAQSPLQPILRDTTARLNQELPLARPLLLELLGRAVQLLPDQIVQHDNVGAGGDGLVCLGKGLAFDVNEKGVACDAPHGLDGFGD